MYGELAKLFINIMDKRFSNSFVYLENTQEMN